MRDPASTPKHFQGGVQGEYTDDDCEPRVSDQHNKLGTTPVRDAASTLKHY